MKLLENWYVDQTKNNNLVFDTAQLAILQQFDQFITNFNQSGFLLKWFSRPTCLGFYVHGSVGSGKSMIINAFYEQFPVEAKVRLHFHEFMQDIHQQLAELKNHDNPLQVIAANLKTQYKIIFLDEMHVSDIATAMILKNLFSALFAEEIYIVTSSNYAPDELYPDGLMRERFLPAIDLIKQKLTIIPLSSSSDYRLLHNSFNQLFFTNETNASDYQQGLVKIFNSINQNNGYEEYGQIIIQSRAIDFVRKSNCIIWFEFKLICGDQRSQLDYLELIKKFRWFIIDKVYALESQDKDVARRFTWLIDILYDNQCKLALASSTTLEQIYSHGDFANEFTRTVSRLQEMQTKEYLEKQPLTL